MKRAFRRKMKKLMLSETDLCDVSKVVLVNETHFGVFVFPPTRLWFLGEGEKRWIAKRVDALVCLVALRRWIPWELIAMAMVDRQYLCWEGSAGFPLSTGLMASLRGFKYESRRQAMGSYHPKRIAGVRGQECFLDDKGLH